VARLWNAGRLAPRGGVQALSGFGAPEGGSASLVLGLAVVLISCIPTWALLLWAAASSLSWRWRAEMSRKRFLMPVAGFAAVIGGGYGLSWVMHRLFGRSRPTEQDVVSWVWIVQQFLAVITFIVVASARTSSGAGTASGAHRKRRRGRAVVLAWTALAVVFALLRAGPFGDSAPPGDWLALAVSSGVLVTLMVLLIIAIVELRRDATGSGPPATRNA
jgi:hypothetical protein